MQFAVAWEATKRGKSNHGRKFGFAPLPNFLEFSHFSGRLAGKQSVWTWGKSTQEASCWQGKLGFKLPSNVFSRS